jgi:hypothetical protein
MRPNRTVVYVMGALVVVLAIASALGGGSKQSTPTSFLAGGNFRAVVVPTDRPRTVVVTPCDAPSPTTGAGALTTPGVTAVRLTRTGGKRTVLIPRCVAPKGTALNGTANLPSAAFVLKPGEQPTMQPKPAPTGVQSQVLVPSDSPADTIVVPPCRAGTKPVGGTARQVVLAPGAAGTAVAPAC